MNILRSWFNSFKTDLETYIYITLQKAIYDLNSACSASALVNLTPEPKPKNILWQSESVKGHTGGRPGMEMANFALSLSQSPSSATQILQDYIITFCPTQKYLEGDESSDKLSNLTYAKFLTHKGKKKEREGKGRNKDIREKEVRDGYFYKPRWRVKLSMGE